VIHDPDYPEMCPCRPYRSAAGIWIHRDPAVPPGIGHLSASGLPVILSDPIDPRRPVMPRWLACLIGAVVCVLIALILAPYIPDPGDQIVAIIAWVGAAVLAIIAVLQLVRGGTGAL
jgi:hypothetical protein